MVSSEKARQPQSSRNASHCTSSRSGWEGMRPATVLPTLGLDFRALTSSRSKPDDRFTGLLSAGIIGVDQGDSRVGL